MKSFGKLLSPQWIIAGIFLLTILLGTCLLMLPFASTANGSISFLSALFTATSALCVTGLTVINIGTELTLFGQLVVLFLIQLGGLGIMTIGTFILVIIGERLSLQSESVLMQTLGAGKSHSLRSLILTAVGFSLIFEILGTILLWLCYLSPPPEYMQLMGNGMGKPFYYALFHSVSAFCNAGFSLHSESLVLFRETPLYLLTTAFLIIAGGLGFLVIYSLSTIKFWQRNRMTRGRVTLNAKIVVGCTLFLLVLGTALIIVQEWNNTIAPIEHWHNKVITAFFQAVTPRTAGFNAVPMVQLHDSTRFTTTVLMFIGGSPGSAAGGIKTTTFFVLILTVISICKGRTNTVLAHRCIPLRVVREAIIIFMLFLMGILLAYGLLLYSEHPASSAIASDLFFETVSAFATVGLSMDTTPTLSSAGRFIIIVCMFIGRLGPMTIALLIGSRKIVERIRYPEEDVVVG